MFHPNIEGTYYFLPDFSSEDVGIGRKNREKMREAERQNVFSRRK